MLVEHPPPKCWHWQGVDLPHAGYMMTGENPPQSRALIIECGVDERDFLTMQLNKSDKNSGRWCKSSHSETQKK